MVWAMKKKTKLLKSKRKINQKYGIISISLAVVVGIGGLVTTFAATRPVFSVSAWDSTMDAAIHSDDAQSVTLPNGNVLWVFGDTIAINGKPTIGSFGYPHDAFVEQTANTQKFTPLAGKYGYGWQQVPNWSNGDYFWMSTPIVQRGNLFVLGQRIRGVANFQVIGDYEAEFDSSTLAYKGMIQIPSGASGVTVWGGETSTSSGRWITGTHGVSCSYATDCKVGDLAFVPWGDMGAPSTWQVHLNVIPASDNVGTTLGIVKSTTGWDIFTKLGDSYGGSSIERLSAASLTGAWTVTGNWASPSPSGAVSYAAAVHPEQAAPAGDILVSYAVNDSKSICWPQFLYLPIN